MAAAFEPGSFDANGTIGALEIGVLASYILLGVETTQAYIYYSRFPKDPRKIKLLVAFIWICELGHSVCIGHALYIVTISDYGHPERILRVPQSLDTTIFLSGLIGASVQCFFASRIYMLTGNPVVSSFCWMLSFLRLLGCTVLFAYALGMSDVTVFDAHWGWLFNTIWAISSTNDISIAATLVYTLYQQRATLQSKKTIVLLDKIINWTLETGVISSAVGAITLICFVTFKNKFIWLAWLVVTAKLFANSLFASLNSRTILREIHNKETTFNA